MFYKFNYILSINKINCTSFINIKILNKNFKILYLINKIYMITRKLNFVTWQSKLNYNENYFSLNRTLKHYFLFLNKIIQLSLKFILISNINSLFYKIFSIFNFILFNISYKWISHFVGLTNYNRYLNNKYFYLLTKYMKKNKISNVLLICSKVSIYTHEMLETGGFAVWSIGQKGGGSIKKISLSITFVPSLNFVKFFCIMLLNYFFYVNKIKILNLIKTYLTKKKIILNLI